MVRAVMAGRMGSREEEEKGILIRGYILPAILISYANFAQQKAGTVRAVPHKKRVIMCEI